MDRRPPVKMESRDERITFRVAQSLKDTLAAAALEYGDELARYCRDCLVMGHTMRESQKMLKRTVG
jgi:hypothetical protein